MKSIALCRVSTPEQKMTNHSLDRQELNVHKFAEELEAPIVKLWSLDQSSRVGKNLNRKDLKEMMEYCKAHKQIKYLIVDEVDRFMRSVEEFFWYEVEFGKLGVELKYASNRELNDKNPMAKLLKVIKVFQAEASNDERITKTMNGLKARVKAGYYPFPVLQGYRRTMIPGLFEPDPERFYLLQSAMKDIIQGRATVSEALVSLTNKGYRTTTGKILRIDRFREILVDDYYAGLVSVKKWDPEEFHGLKGLHKPMITVEEHEELKAIVFGKKRIFERKKDNKQFPMGNIILCECGGKLVGLLHRNGKGWTSPKYRCRTCGKQFHAKTLHVNLDSKFEDALFSKDKEDGFIEALNEVWKEGERITLDKISELQKRLEQLKFEEKQAGMKMVMNNDPEKEPYFKEVIKEYKDKIKSLEKEISENEDIEHDHVEFITFSLRFLDGKLNNWKHLDRDHRIKCKQLAFLGEIFVNYSEKVCTPEISPILSLISNKKEPETSPDSLMVEARGVAPLSKRSKTYILQV